MKGPTEFEDWLNQPVTTPMVAETVSWLGLRILGAWDWEFGLCKILEEMTEEGLLILRDRRLQIAIRDHDCDLVSAYYPMHQHKWLARYVDLKPTTRVLLVINQTAAESQSPSLVEKELRHHLGHVLLYLRDPRSKNDCAAAEEEWKRCTQDR